MSELMIFKRDEIESKIDWENSVAYDGKIPKWFGLIKISDKSYEIYNMANGVRYQIGFLKTFENL